MIITILAICGYGMMYILGFAMSFDAPGSTSDPKAWWMRFLMFTPILIFIAILIVSAIAFFAGNYKKAAFISGIVPVLSACFIVFMFYSSFTAMKDYRTTVAKEKEDERLYPKQTFLRSSAEGADTIIVFPSRIVAYRLVVGREYPHNGPLGDLNEDRTTIIYINRPDTKLSVEELDQFVDEEGRRLTEVYIVSNTKK